MDSVGEGRSEADRKELQEALNELVRGEWYVFRGVHGTFYARLVSTPQRGKFLNRPSFRGETKDEVLAQVRQWAGRPQT